MYAAHRRRLPIIVPPWLTPTSRHESLPAYAARMAAALPVRGRFILGGSSFGGMVAWEMARHCRPGVLALIGSATRPDEIAAWLRAPADLAPIVPLGAVRLIQPFAGRVARLGGMTDRSGEPVISAMTRDCPPAFLRWCVAAIAGWRPSAPPPVRCVRLHGGADVVIHPPAPVRDVTHVARACHHLDGGHAAAVIAWLARIRAQLRASAASAAER
jgi:pimeloyl-ACP methyl ester carboxylesterase